MKFNRIFLQKIALALSIIVVLNMLFNYGLYTFYPSPKYDNFCGEEGRQYYGDKESCEAIGGEWMAYNQGAYPRPAKVVTREGSVIDEPTEYCDATASCGKLYNETRSLYNRNVFIALVSLGIVSVILGFFFVAVSAVSMGLIFGGLISVFIGNIRYWSDMNDYLRLVVLAIALAALIWIGYRKLKD